MKILYDIFPVCQNPFYVFDDKTVHGFKTTSDYVAFENRINIFSGLPIYIVFHSLFLFPVTTTNEHSLNPPPLESP